MIWVEQAKRSVSEMLSDDDSLRILNTAYKDKYVTLECELMTSGETFGVIYIVEFDDFGKLGSIRQYVSVPDIQIL